MPEDGAGFHAAQCAAHHVKVCAADGSSGDSYNGVCWLLDLWLWNFVEADVAYPVKHNGLHGFAPFFLGCDARMRWCLLLVSCCRYRFADRLEVPDLAS